MTTKPRGGARQGAGRKPKDGATGAETTQVCARIWKRQHAAFKALGGSEWLRRMIDAETQANAKGQRGAEGASAAPTGCASNVTTESNLQNSKGNAAGGHGE